jgi:hypothetical protein
LSEETFVTNASLFPLYRVVGDEKYQKVTKENRNNIIFLALLLMRNLYKKQHDGADDKNDSITASSQADHCLLINSYK